MFPIVVGAFHYFRWFVIHLCIDLFVCLLACLFTYFQIYIKPIQPYTNHTKNVCKTYKTNLYITYTTYIYIYI